MRGQKQRCDPPAWLSRLLLWFCDDDLVEAMEGDLYEAYKAIRRQRGVRAADLFYFRNVMRFLKPRFMQKLSNTQDYVPKMGNYLKVSLRNFGKYKLVSAINLLGFAIGLSVIVLAGEYVHYQLSADRFVPHADRVYRIIRGYRSQVYANLAFNNYCQSGKAAQMMNVEAFRQLPEIESVAQFAMSNSAIMGREYFVEAGDKRLPENKVLFTNTPTAFQDIFQWKVLAGRYDGNLMNKVVVTERTAHKYFGEDWVLKAVGASMKVGQSDYVVAAVIEDVPDNAHFDFSIAVMVEVLPNSWGAYTYALFKPFEALEAMEEKVTEAGYLASPNAREDPLEKGLYLQPLTSIHLGSDHLYELENNINPVYIYLFAIIGLVMLLITSTNYINLTVAIYANRFKEVGVRKVIGARKKDIRSQFLFESVFTTLLALPVALGLVYISLPYFNGLMAVKLQQAVVFSATHLGLVVFITLVIGMVCGLYPAVVLARRPPLSLFQKGGQAAFSGVRLRKLLIGLQFLLLMVLSGFAFYLNRQLHYVNEKELGFDREGILYFGLRSVEKYELIKAELLKNPNVLGVGTGGLPGNNPFNTMTYRFEGIDEVFDDAHQVYMDLGAARALGLWSSAFEDLVQGKRKVMVMNETAALKYEQITGKNRSSLLGSNLIEAPRYENEDGSFGFRVPIDGFIDDYNYFSLREQHSPLFIHVYRKVDWVSDMHVKINPDALYQTVDFVQDTYYQYEQEQPFNGAFLEDRLRLLYGNENRIADLVAALSYLSVLLAFAGLIGLTYYMARLRQREVAIRKVLGAGMSSLLGIMSREFLIMALVASLIAIPLTLYAVNFWLESFAFHIMPDVFTLLILGLLGMLFMLVAVVSQSYHTANSNPVGALKQE